MHQRAALVICVIIALVGCVLIIKSNAIGKAAWEAELSAELPKPFEQQNIDRTIEARITADYRLIGTILFGGGILGFVINLRGQDR